MKPAANRVQQKWRGHAVTLLAVRLTRCGHTRLAAARHARRRSGRALQGVTLAGQTLPVARAPKQAGIGALLESWCTVCRAEQGSITAISHDNPNVITVAMQAAGPEAVIQLKGSRGSNFRW